MEAEIATRGQMKWCPLALRFLLGAAVACLSAGANAEDAQKLDTLCKEAGVRLVNAEAADPQHREFPFWADKGANIHFSFSQTISACVGTRINYLSNEWTMLDINSTFSDDKLLFECRKSGANNMNLDAVRRFNGRVYNLSYRLWMDDGEGGLPATTQQPADSYGRDRCDGLFKKKLVELHFIDPSEIP